MAKPLTREEIANTERKLDMPLDDIIKMSKNTTNRPKKQQRASNKSQKVFNNSSQEKALKVRSYMNSRRFVRQGALAQRRSNFQGSQFPLAREVARNAATASFRNRPFSRNVAAHTDKARPGSFMVQRGAANGGYAAKSQQRQSQQQAQAQRELQQQEGDGGVKQRPKTLDSLFANMKEQRMKSMSRQNNSVPRGGNAGRPMVPWARGRFAY
ncbi:hypothetical protein Tsubulata_045645 [Turnera subulata]|uniref:Uncharacterized protein n=1 Tax=Turnera subulata TaxID=218843 RepID=A0A9Q0JKV1_9ROSI|nr:hypothetical protein Tsubulata_045645 [Turnera subulata]